MKKDLFWNSIGTAAWSFLSLFLLIVVTRINGIDDSGLFSFAFAFAFIMFTIGCYGGRAYQVSDYKDSFKTSSYISLRFLTSAATIVVAVAFILLNGYSPDKSALILLLVAQKTIDAIADVFYGVMQKQGELHLSGRSLFFKSILSFVVFLLIDLLTKNLLLASFSLPIISLAFLIFYDIPRSRRLEKFTISPWSNDMMRILKSTSLPFSITVLSLIFVNVARYFIDIYHPSMQGYFGILIMPLSLITLFFSFIYTPLIVGFTEKFNRGNLGALRHSVRSIVLIVCVSTIIFSVLAYFLGAPLLQILFGVDFSSFRIDLVLVMIIGASVSLSSLFSNISIVARSLRKVGAIYLLSSIILAITCLVVVGPHGIRGAVTAYIVISFTQTLALAIHYRRITSS